MLTGCSNNNTAKGPTVSDTVAQVISASEMSDGDNMDKEPPRALADSSIITSSVVRSPSSRAIHKPVKEPAVQIVQGYALQATNTSDIKPAHEPPSNKRVIKEHGKSNRSSQSYHTVLVGDAVKDVLGSRNKIRKSTVMDVMMEVIPAVQISDDGNVSEESQNE